MSDPSSPQYSAAKAALSNYTCVLAKTLAPKILVNAVAPGYTWTPNWEGTPEKRLRLLEDRNKIKRFVTAEEIATMVIELLKKRWHYWGNNPCRWGTPSALITTPIQSFSCYNLIA